VMAGRQIFRAKRPGWGWLRSNPAMQAAQGRQGLIRVPIERTWLDGVD